MIAKETSSCLQFSKKKGYSNQVIQRSDGFMNKIKVVKGHECYPKDRKDQLQNFIATINTKGEIISLELESGVILENTGKNQKWQNPNNQKMYIVKN